MATNHTSAGQHATVVTRSERVAQRSAGQSFLADVAVFLQRDHLGKFTVLMFLTAIALSFAIGAWNAPFRYRVNGIADRSIICNTPFSIFSSEQTRLEKDRARATAPRVFVNDPQPLVQLREALIWNTISGLIRTSSYDELGEQEKQTWIEFFRPSGQEEVSEEADIQAAFADFAAYFNDKTNFDDFQECLSNAFYHAEQRGVLNKLTFGTERGSQDRILVYRKQSETPEQAIEYMARDVLLRDGTPLREDLLRNIGSLQFGEYPLCDLLFNWLHPKIPDTLTEDPHATAKMEEEAAENVGDVMIGYAQGQLLVSAGVALQQSDVNLLLVEYRASLNSRVNTTQISRFLSAASVFFIVMMVMFFLVLRLERRRPHSPLAFFYLMLGIIGTVATAKHIQPTIATYAEWEILPLMLFVMIVSIVYSWELATALSIFLTIVITSGNGGDIELFIILLGTSVATTVQLGRLRSREKLIIVGIVVGLVSFFLTIALGIHGNRMFNKQLIIDAAVNFSWAFVAGLLMTGMLPFVEKQFGILTDMSLRELGDVSHPLIQKLIKAAPATYEHCMQVGSIAEAAAEVIKARGLLVRVGAHFHDIGKIMKPEYFSENQGGISNVHDTLEPQLSTIVLIAHIKDGVDMARQYHLPRPLIDLIEQHHGTSLISFFYSRATKGGTEEVGESTFRYPGPKPRMKEAAILMIADTCESACRSMGAGVQPNKVEAKIRALIKQKLDDGQFDESGLTLGELKIIEKSVTNSIVAAMHGRIQYPEAATEKSGHTIRTDIIMPDYKVTGDKLPGSKHF